MAGSGRGVIAGLVRRASARQWAAHGTAIAAPRVVPDPDLCAEARSLHSDLSHFLQRADALRQGYGASALPALPAGTEWRWRVPMVNGALLPPVLVSPPNASAFGWGAMLWHDCPRAALILRQRQNRDIPDRPPYFITLEVMGFAGSYLSLSLELPTEALAGIDGNHILRVDALMGAERDITVYARLNIAQGPNTETMLRQMGHPISGNDARREAEFDIAYADLSAHPVDRAWVDLIFEAPGMNAVGLYDIILSRQPRAQV